MEKAAKVLSRGDEGGPLTSDRETLCSVADVDLETGQVITTTTQLFRKVHRNHQDRPQKNLELPKHYKLDFREEISQQFEEYELWFKIFSGIIKVSEVDFKKLISKC